MGGKKDKLTGKQKRFVDEYLIDFNATQAAKRAGYKEANAFQTGAENLKKPKIAAALEKAQREMQERTHVTVDDMILQLARLGFSDIRKIFSKTGGLLPIADLPDDIAMAISSVEVITKRGSSKENGKKVVEQIHKIRLTDKMKPLEMLGKHMGMGPENNQIDNSISDLLSKFIQTRKD